MKRIAIVCSLLSLMTAGCAKVELDNPVPEVKYEVILSGECDTKTSLAPEVNGRRKILWKAGDMLGLFVAEDGTPMSGAQNVVARLYDGKDTGPGFSNGAFVTNLSIKTSKTYTLGIYYPYIKSAGSSSEISHRIPAVQTQSAAAESRHLGPSGAFSYATATFVSPDDMKYYDTPVVNFRMDHKTSTVMFALKATSSDMEGWKVKSVTLKAPEGCAIAGDVKYVPAEDTFSLTGNTSESVTLNVPGGVALSASTEAELYMVVFPAAIAGKDIEITYNLENADASAVKTLTHTRTIRQESDAFCKASQHVFREDLPASDAEGWVYSTAPQDLSAGGTSNCYIVSAPGRYSFDATVIGNGQKGILTPVSTTFFHTESASISPAKAELLWQTAPKLIKSVSYADGKITFEKSSEAEYGNALIAAKDAEGTILWSWHIWCTELGDLQTWVSPTATYEAMDRNLGATYTSNTAVEGSELVTRTLGLYYAFGRKDPFVGPIHPAASASEYSSPMAPIYDINGAGIARPEAENAWVSKEEGSIEYTIKHPTTFLYVQTTSSASDYCSLDWFVTEGKGGGPDHRGYYLWGNPEGYDYAKDAKPTPVKTIYDPCPPGYMITPSDMYTGMTIVKGVSAVGTVVNTGTVDTWIPMNSCLQSQSKVDADKRGKWRGDKYAYLWTSQFRGAGSYYIATHMRMNATKIITHNHWNNAYGFGVRCVQEIH